MAENNITPPSGDKGNKSGMVGKGRPPVEHQFKPGHNAPGPGRPRGSISLTERLRQKLNEGNGKEVNSLIAATLKNAKSGNGIALKLIWDRIEGPIVNKIEISDDIAVIVRLFAQELSAEQDIPEAVGRRVLAKVLDSIQNLKAGGILATQEEDDEE